MVCEWFKQYISHCLYCYDLNTDTVQCVSDGELWLLKPCIIFFLTDKWGGIRWRQSFSSLDGKAVSVIIGCKRWCSQDTTNCCELLVAPEQELNIDACSSFSASFTPELSGGPLGRRNGYRPALLHLLAGLADSINASTSETNPMPEPTSLQPMGLKEPVPARCLGCYQGKRFSQQMKFLPNTTQGASTAPDAKF